VLLDRLPDGSIQRVFLLYPDPWPKARHADRRFIRPENLDRLARVMADGGELRIATDHPVYKVWTLAQLGRRCDFAWLARRSSDWSAPPADWPATRYQEKARSEGRMCLYLRYERLPRTK
jgi:tRNA (guanine-N7-)-methyltransferase